MRDLANKLRNRTLAASVLMAVCGCSPQPTPGDLAAQAMSDSADAAQREAAAAALVSHPQVTVAELQQIFNRSDDPHVRAAAAVGLGRARDWESMPALIDAMRDPSPLLRGRAGQAVVAVTGHDAGFKANDPEAQRQAAIADIEMRWALLHKGFLAKQAYLKTGELPTPSDEGPPVN